MAKRKKLEDITKADNAKKLKTVGIYAIVGFGLGALLPVVGAIDCALLAGAGGAFREYIWKDPRYKGWIEDKIKKYGI